MGEGGLATTLIVAHLRHVVPQTDTARDFTNELLPYLWRFRASPQGLKGHTNEMKPLVTRIGDDPIPSGSKPDILPTQTHGYYRGDLSFPSIYIISLSFVLVNTFLIFFYFNYNYVGQFQIMRFTNSIVGLAK